MGVTTAAVRAGTTNKLGYRPGLDGLRGVAILLVLAGHFDVPPFANAGMSGVTLFFALSGFLITSLLLEERQRSGTVDLAGFYVRRARRLFPALVVVLVVSAPFLGWFDLTAVALYFGNWVKADGGDLGFLNHTWSLAIEEQFYLVWPAVMLWWPQHAKRVAVVGIGFAVVLRVVLWDGDASVPLIYNATFTRMDAILAGCLLAMTSWRPRQLWPALAALVALCTVTDLSLIYQAGFTITAALSVLAVSAAAQHHGILTTPLLVWFGKRSYGLYLWHGIFVFGFDPEGWTEKGMVLAASLAAAELSWRLIETRWLRPPLLRVDEHGDDAAEPSGVVRRREISDHRADLDVAGHRPGRASR